MSIVNIESNPIPFKDQQLTYRKTRIEELTRDVRRKSQQVEKYKKAFKEECDYVKQLRDLFVFTLDTLKEDVGELPNADGVLSVIDKHIQINDNFFNKK
jgi:hypothetical protein